MTAPGSVSRDAQQSAPIFGAHDSVWNHYADQLPGFGGLFYDDNGDLVVLLKDSTQAAKARSQFGSRLGQSHRPSWLPSTRYSPALRVAHATFDYHELTQVKYAASVAIRRSNSPVNSIGIDDERNVVRIGVSDAAAAGDLRQMLTAAGIGSSAIDVVVSPAGKALADTFLINNYHAPLLGGEGYSSPSTCSIGLPIWYTIGGTSGPFAGMLSANHCVDSVGGQVFALDTLNNALLIGNWIEPGFYVYPCVHGVCRWADAAVAQLHSYGLSYVKGGIAHMTTVGIGGSLPAGRNAYDPTTYSGTANGPFMVAADETPGGEVVGQYVGRVGQGTGYTYGQISAVGQDVQRSDGTWVVDNVFVNAAVLGGDSGGPASMLGAPSVGGNPGVTFAGIVWQGRNASGGHYTQYAYSPLIDIRSEFLLQGIFITTH